MDNNDSNPKKTRKKGIVYLSTIPPFMNVTKLTEIMSQFGKVGRVFLQPEATKPGTKKKKKINKKLYFTEGWVEFLSKRVAKEVAVQLNNQQVSSQKKSRYYDTLWNIKYLPHFKWEHLSERLEYERAVYRQRMRAEIAQAKREATHFANNIEISESHKERRKKLNTNSINIDYKQRRTDDEIQQGNEKHEKNDDRTDFLKELFVGSDS